MSVIAKTIGAILLLLSVHALAAKPTPDATKQIGSAGDQFVGKWYSLDAADVLEISRADGIWKIVYREHLGSTPPPEVRCVLREDSLVGDYYGHSRNFRVEWLGPSRIALSIDPYAEFEPIRNQVFRRPVNYRDAEQFGETVFKALQANRFAILASAMPASPAQITFEDRRGKLHELTAAQVDTIKQQLQVQFAGIVTAFATEGVSPKSLTLAGITLHENERARIVGDGFVVNIYLFIDAGARRYTVRIEDCMRSGDTYLPEQLKWYGTRPPR